jgi:uncharacterized protein YgbK (DUF1537 family)
MSLLILADDLTGAADCAARCRGAGMPASIALHVPTPPLPPGALAFTSDSRHMPPNAAAERVRELTAGLRDQTGVTWSKKLDSTLRGNLGAELDAMLSALGREHALICPAFPAQGRGLRDGFLISPAAPAQQLHLPTLLKEQSRQSIELVALDDVRGGTTVLAERLDTARRRARLLVADALADADLHALLEAAAVALPDALLCGSAGLIGTLARRRSSSEQTAVPPRMPGPALLVVGSGSPMARRQIAHLCEQQPVQAIEVDAYDQRPTTNDQHSVVVSPVQDILLHLPEPAIGAKLDGPAARDCAARLAAAALPLIEQLGPALLVLVGGDTAFHMLDRMGVRSLEVLSELLPGMPLARGASTDGREYMVILKAGNHGDPATLATLLGMREQSTWLKEQS